MSPYFLAFIVLAYAKSLPEEGQFHFICILEFYSLHKARTRCIQSTCYTGWYSTLLVPGICYFQFFVWCILFADLPRFGSLNIAPVLLVSDSPGKSMHISIPVCNNVYSYIITQVFFLIDRLFSCIELIQLY